MDKVLEYENLVYSLMKKFYNYPYKDDLYQVGIKGLIEAYNHFKDNMGCKFSTYAYMYIYGEMKKLVREDKGIKISRQISKLNLQIEKAYVLLTQKNMKEPTIIGYSVNYDDKIVIKEQLSKLSSEELDLIKYRYMNDFTQTETSKILNMSQVQVSRKEQKILKKLRDKMIV